MKSLWRRILSNSLLLLAARIIAKVATIIVMVGIARLLGVEEFGAFSTMIALTTVSGIISDFGLVLPTIRSISNQSGEAPKLMGNTVTTRLTWGAAGVLAVVATGFAIQLAWLPLLLFALSAVLDTSSTALIRCFEGKLEMRVVTMYTLVERSMYCVVVLGGLWWSRNLFGVAVSYTVSYSLAFLFALWTFQRRFGRVQIAAAARNLWRHTRLGLPFVLSAVCSALYYKADTLLLNMFRTNTEVGFYNAALRIIDAQIFIPASVMASVFPALSLLYGNDQAGFHRVFRRSLFTFLAGGAFFAALFFAVSNPLIRILYSSSYEQSVPVLRVLSLILPFLFADYVLVHALVAIHCEKIYMGATVGATVLNVAANAILIPKFGVAGAAWTRVGCEAVLFLSMGALFLNRFRSTDARPDLAMDQPVPNPLE